ncbi:MAG TPA: OFA family MFS transporter [Caulobacteraceae bacterium]|jgi:MFS family permease
MAQGVAGDQPASTSAGFLDRESIVAKAGFNRWLIPPCALAIHLCIGMAYGFSVFWLPLSKSIGIGKAVACPAGAGLMQMLTTSSCDWSVSQLTLTYSLFFVVLGSASAIWGGWLERAGPRKAGVVAALCWCGGMVLGAIGVKTHQLWLLWLGSGVLGGIGLGIGYITPVSTLIKWFPDKRGMATGMAIMGFGGGAMIGSPLADILMKHFASASSVGVAPTLVVMAAGYFVFMLGGAFSFRVPPDHWTPEGWTASPKTGKGISAFNVHLKDAHKTPQFWLVWCVLLLNTSASIGIIGVASPMIQQIFGGHLIGAPGVDFAHLDKGQAAMTATVAAGFVGLLSLFNIGGRFFWASASDLIGRKMTYAVMLALGAFLFGAIATWSATAAVLAAFVLSFCITTSMYGGGFSTVPAYLADVFGTQYVGAIHGRLLTAWSTAGILGPFIVAGVQDRYKAAGGAVSAASIYQPVFLLLAGLLVAGFLLNLLVKPVSDRWHMTGEEARTALAESHGSAGIDRGRFDAITALAWAAVGIPLLWGVWVTLTKAITLFHQG